MRATLTALASGRIPAPDYTEDDLRAYVDSLLDGQRGPIGQLKAGSWGLLADDEGAGSDVRVDFL